jgi:hypothetical protein
MTTTSNLFLAAQCPLCGYITGASMPRSSEPFVQHRTCENCGAMFTAQDPHGYTASKPESEESSTEEDFIPSWLRRPRTAHPASKQESGEAQPHSTEWASGGSDVPTAQSSTLNLDTARATMDAAYKLLATCTVVAGGGYSEKERADSANMLDARILLLEWLSGMR